MYNVSQLVEEKVTAVLRQLYNICTENEIPMLCMISEVVDETGEGINTTRVCPQGRYSRILERVSMVAGENRHPIVISACDLVEQLQAVNARTPADENKIR